MTIFELCEQPAQLRQGIGTQRGVKLFLTIGEQLLLVHLIIHFFITQAGITCDHHKIDMRLFLLATVFLAIVFAVTIVLILRASNLRARFLGRLKGIYNHLILLSKGILDRRKHDADGERMLMVGVFIELLSQRVSHLQGFVGWYHHNDIVAADEQDIERELVVLCGKMRSNGISHRLEYGFTDQFGLLLYLL